MDSNNWAALIQILLKIAYKIECSNEGFVLFEKKKNKGKGGLYITCATHLLIVNFSYKLEKSSELSDNKIKLRGTEWQMKSDQTTQFKSKVFPNNNSNKRKYIT